MKRKILLRACAITTVLFIVSVSCTKNTPLQPVISDAIKAGNYTEAVKTTVSASGGNVEVTAAGNPLAGMSITVPQNAFSQNVEFTIGSMPITSHKLGSNFNPVTPLIRIACSGGYADSFMSVTVPVRINAGDFAMPFMYDERTGTLEGLRMTALGDSSITFVSRHFALSAVSSSSSGLGKRSALDVNAFTDIVISAITYGQLSGLGTVTTHFTPGIDDWEFVNAGSYIAPNGHCAGQSITMAWYYYEKKLTGAPALFGRYEQIPGSGKKPWEDNPYGYRFASVIQKDLQWDGKLYKLFESIEQDSMKHYISWYEFIYSMLLTGDPQFVGLTRTGGGHAILAHKVSVPDKILFVTDPNFPGQERTITYTGSKFLPYDTKQNVNETNFRSYWGVGYYAKTSMIDWDKISVRWKEFETKTIGNDKFPAYQFRYNETSDQAAWTQYAGTVCTDSTQIYFSCKSPAAAQFYTGTDALQFIQVYSEKGDSVCTSEGASLGTAAVPLAPGMNTFGVAIFCFPNASAAYVDFIWVKVFQGSIAVNPPTASGKAGSTISFSADTAGSLGGARLAWWVLGAANDTVSRNPNAGAAFSYTFSKNGSYRVVCGVVDKDGRILVTAGSSVTISDNPSVSRDVNYDFVFKYSAWPRTVWAFNIKGTITGNVDTIWTDSIFANVYITMERGTFTFIGTSQGSITSPLTVDTVYPDKSRDVYYYTNTGMVPDVSGGFVPRVFDVKDGNIHIESEISGSLYMDVGYKCRWEQYDSTGTLVDSATSNSRLPALKLHFDFY